MVVNIFFDISKFLLTLIHICAIVASREGVKIMETHENIKALREKQGLSQEALAQRTGYKDRSSIAKIEAGLVDLTQSKIAAFAKALNVTPANLMGIVDDPSPLPSDAIPLDLSNYHRIPILGRISAGLPLYAEEHIEGYTITDLNGGAEYFALRVHGDSMNALRINEGDIIIVRRQDEVEQGEIAVVLVDGEDATVKRFYSSDTTVTLMPQSTNPEHKPQMYDLSKTAIRVLGRVVEVKFSI